MENFNQKQYEQATPIPAKFLLPDGSISDELPTSGGQGDIYTTEETVIGKWIDGKPIYRRVYTGNVSNRTIIDETTPFDVIVSVKGSTKQSGSNEKNPIAGYLYGNGYGCAIGTDANNKLRASIDRWGTVQLYAIVEYTKTTD